MINKQYYKNMEGAIAVIGMSGSFPKAGNIEEFWQNILDGRECMDDLTEDDLKIAGIPQEIYNNPNYVKRSASLESAKEFDPSFFGYTPGEARLMDPQHRLFLEHSWKCLEDGNVIPDEYDGLIGVFGGCSQNNYLLKNIIFSNQAITAGDFQIMIGNDKDYLTSKVSYKLNLKGPSITIQTACSTSLTAIQQGCLSLLNYQSDMALCGGVSVNVPNRGGYLYRDGLIFSPDGQCRAFDKDANGTIFGDGVGVVLLKRFEEAFEEKDNIYAIIRGSAINNDGSEKVGYTAPGVRTQAEVIATALAVADISADNIGYVEAHGTGTLMGDPIELAALTEAFRMSTKRNGFCHIGSVKPNIGHLDAAAGVAGFIKAVMILNSGIIPPQINYTSPNPALNIENSPFKISTEQHKWETEGKPRRAGVSALGVGGTNVHLILEEYIPESIIDETKESIPQLLVFSAKSKEALKRKKESFTSFLANKEDSLSSIAFTLQKKRVTFPYRDYLVLKNINKFNRDVFLNSEGTVSVRENTPRIAFLFTGQGSQYPEMGKDLYGSIPFIRSIMDKGFNYLKMERNLDLMEIIFPVDRNSQKASEEKLMQTTYTQPALFILEYAISSYMMELGIKPAYLLGHSLGEFTAACLSGIFTFEDALALVADRGRIMQTAQKGSMISVPLTRSEIEEILPSDQLQVSVINAPDRCVISGTSEAADLFIKELELKEIPYSRLKTSHAYHSFLMDSILDDFSSCFSTVEFNEPKIPIITNLTGGIPASEEMSKPEYWIDQLRQPVNFEKGISFLLKEDNISLLEIGPGNTLITLARFNPSMSKECLCLSTIRGPKQQIADDHYLISTLGKIWQKGFSIDWEKLHGMELPSYARIPSYEFENKEYWIDSLIKTISFQDTNTTETSNTDSCEKDIISTKQKVRLIWNDIFGVSNIKDNDNFYDLGGHSVLATQLLAQLNDAFKTEIGMGALLMEPTPANSCLLIERELAQMKSAESQIETVKSHILPMMFPVQKGDSSKTPLFMVAGLYFNSYYHSEEEGQRKYEEDYFRYFSTLVNNIGSQQPIYGFRPKGIFLHEETHRNVKEMAKAYIDAIKTIQPEGPYLIGGECIGGIIALEMAQQLIQKGEKIKHLIMMDTFYPRGKSLFIDSLHIARERIIDELSYPFKRTDIKFPRKAVQFMTRLLELFIPLTKKQKALRAVNLGNIFYLRKLRRYQPYLYSDPNISILANEEWLKSMSSTLEWTDKYIKNLNIIPIPGTHVTRLTENGHITGEHIRRIIDGK